MPYHDSTERYAVDDMVNWETQAEIMRINGYIQDDSGQWVRAEEDDSQPPSPSSKALPAGWPNTEAVVRRHGRRKSSRAAVVEPKPEEHIGNQ